MKTLILTAILNQSFYCELNKNVKYEQVSIKVNDIISLKSRDCPDKYCFVETTSVKYLIKDTCFNIKRKLK